MSTINAPDAPYWSAWQKAVFRFFIIYFALFLVLLKSTDVFRFLYPIMDYYTEIFQRLVVWLAANVLHLSKPITEFPNGSGDTTYDYVCLLLFFILSGIAAVTWSLTDRKERNYDKLFYWVLIS